MRVKSIALGGVLLAFVVMLLYGAVVLPTMNLTLFAAASFVGAVMVLEAGVRAGLLFYVSSSLLGLIFIPNLPAMLPYIMCFGLYPLIKYWIERLHRRSLEIALKLLFLNAAFAAMFFLAKETLLGDADFGKYSVYVMFALMQGAFIAYDLVFSMFLQVYLRRRRKV